MLWLTDSPPTPRPQGFFYSTRPTTGIPNLFSCLLGRVCHSGQARERFLPTSKKSYREVSKCVCGPPRVQQKRKTTPYISPERLVSRPLRPARQLEEKRTPNATPGQPAIKQVHGKRHGPSGAMNTFHCFPDLPPEIQAQICRIEAVPDPSLWILCSYSARA